jgi:hypothetical protein
MGTRLQSRLRERCRAPDIRSHRGSEKLEASRQSGTTPSRLEACSTTRAPVVEQPSRLLASEPEPGCMAASVHAYRQRTEDPSRLDGRPGPSPVERLPIGPENAQFPSEYPDRIGLVPIRKPGWGLRRSRFRNEGFSSKVQETKGLRGGVLLYVAKGNPQVDAEIAEMRRFWTRTG